MLLGEFFSAGVPSCESMKNIRVDLRYDGSRYWGWQIQPDRETVQGVLTKAFASLFGEKLRITGCSRIDRGAHAYRYTASVRIPDGFPDENIHLLKDFLNSKLPLDIRILSVESAKENFDARKDAIWRKYRYFVVPSDNPFIQRYATGIFERDFEKVVSNVNRVRQAASLLCGTKNFLGFSTREILKEKRNPVRTIYDIRVFLKRWDFIGTPVLIFTVRGSSFLPYMIRKMIAFFLAVGRGEYLPGDAMAILSGSLNFREIAPPQGLYLWRVAFREDFSRESLRE